LLDNPVINSDFIFSKSISVNVTPCAVEVDKQVSCDGGATWVDPGLVTNNEDGTFGCDGLDTDQILVRYQVNNSGEADLFACEITESNGAFGAGPVVGNLPFGQTSDFIPAAEAPICQDAEAGEPNTATVSCFCTADLNPAFIVEASDSADFTCLTCEVEVDKQVSCDGGATWFDQGLVTGNQDGTLGCSGLHTNQILVRYQVRNSGEANLAACEIDESNGAFGAGPVVGNLVPNETTFFIPAAETPVCRDADDNEPNTATASCLCAVGAGDETTTAFDSATFECLVPTVLTDRAVSCDGEPFVDQTRVAMNDDGTNGCTTLDGRTVRWEYQAENSGPVPLFDCELADTNPSVSPASIPVGNLAVGQIISGIPATNTVACSDTLEGQEPGTVLLTCCSVDVGALINCPDANKVTAHDASDVVCQSTPELNVVKVCEDANSDGTDEITVIASATAADLDLVNCTAADLIFLDDPACPADQGLGTPVPLNPANPFDIAAGTNVMLTGMVPVTADACNTVTVTCFIEGTELPVSDTSDALCPGRGQGCLTRTPGFWGTHPHITDDFLPQTVCGTPLGNVGFGNGNSAIEAICSVGKDGKILGPQLTQLIRQCTAAYLNVAATLEGDGNCTTEFADLSQVLDACCDAESLCTSDPVGGFSVTHCIDVLDAFNNSLDSLASFGPFLKPGPADPSACQGAKNNGVVVTPTPAP
jgi:hypothetical protein